MNVSKSAIFVLFAFCGCNKNTTSVETFYLKTDISLSALGDSAFFSDIRCITNDKNLYYLTDYERDQVFILDTTLKLVNTFGRKGEGPGELMGTSQINVIGDRIYVHNDSKNAIELFNEKNYLRSIHFPVTVALDANYKYLIKKNRIYFGYSNDTSGICCYNLSDGTMFFFGTLLKKDTPKETRIKNCRHILGYHDKICSISNYKHIIEIYNNDGTLETSYDYSFIEPAKKRLVFVNGKPEAPNNYYNVLSDAYLYNQSLFLLLYSNNDSEVSCNQVLELKIDDTTLAPVRILSLGDGYFRSLCCTKDYMLAFDSRSASIVKFKL